MKQEGNKRLLDTTKAWPKVLICKSACGELQVGSDIAGIKDER